MSERDHDTISHYEKSAKKKKHFHRKNYVQI